MAADLHDVEGGGGQPTIPSTTSSSLSTSESDVYSGADTKRGARQKVSRAYLSNTSPDGLRGVAAALALGTCLLFPFLRTEASIFLLVISSCCFGAIASLWLSRSVLQCDDGTAEMRAVSDPIREGAEG